MLPANLAELDVLLGHIEQRTISARGIELHGLFYNDDSLALLRRRLKSSEPVTIKFDPNELSLIHVADKENGVYLPVPAVDQGYTQGLNLWQHKLIRKFAKKRINENVDIVSLCLAKQKIQEIVEREWLATKRTRTRERLARLKNYGHGKQIEYRGSDTTQDRLALVSKASAEDLPRLEASTGWAGISDCADAIAEPETTADQSVKDSSVSIAQTVPAKSTATRVSRPKRKESSAELPPSQPSITEPSESAPTATRAAEDDLDMAGWHADFSLRRG